MHSTLDYLAQSIKKITLINHYVPLSFQIICSRNILAEISLTEYLRANGSREMFVLLDLDSPGSWLAGDYEATPICITWFIRELIRSIYTQFSTEVTEALLSFIHFRWCHYRFGSNVPISSDVSLIWPVRWSVPFGIWARFLHFSFRLLLFRLRDYTVGPIW